MTQPVLVARRSYGLLCAASAGAIVLGDFLFFHHPLGCSIAVFAAFLLVCLSLRGIDAMRRWEGRVLLLAMFGLIVALIIEPTPLTFLAAIFTLGCLAMLRAGSTLMAWLDSWTRLLVLGWARIVLDNRIVASWIHRNPRMRNSKWNLANWIVPLLLTAVFVGLFAIANPIISKVISTLETRLELLIQRIPELLDLFRILLWLALAAGTWGLMRARLRRSHQGVKVVVPMYPIELFSPESITRCLLLFNIVFLAETVLDVVYLWGGHALPAGMTYSQYARRGAYPLVATALLAAMFVLITFRSGSSTEQSKTCRRLVYLWCAQNIFLLINAAWRLKLYVDADNLTRLRVAAGLWMILVAAGFVWIGWRVVTNRNNAWLLRINMLTAAAMFYVCCFVNIDGRIARYNAEHCREVGGGDDWLDLDYMRVLGTDSLPALAKIRNRLAPVKRVEADQIITYFQDELAAETSDWRGWTLRREKIARQMDKLDPEWFTRRITKTPEPLAAAIVEPSNGIRR